MYMPTPCQCIIQNWIENKELVLDIIYAEKNQVDNHSFIVYTIQTQDMKKIKRRYSEFEGLRKSLVRLYPSRLVPPIPEKHSITEYTRKDENIQVINKRKRMLERFLTRISQHPVLSQEHVFHRFIHGTESWNDILTSAPLSDLPKDPLLPSDYTLTNTSVIPIPSSSHILKAPDPLFEQAEQNVNKTVQEKGNKLDKSQKNILKRLTDLSNDYTELGSVYNALSIYEPSGVLSGFIEKLGQAVDDSCLSTHEMIRVLEIECSEHIQDYSHYIQITQQALKYRHMKQAQAELIQDALDQKNQTLTSLLRKQDESNKLKTDLDSLSISESPPKDQEVGEDLFETESVEDDCAEIIRDDIKIPEEEYEYPASATLSTVNASKKHIKKWSSPKKFLSSFSFAFQGIIDTDPEQTRQNQITKTRETLRQAS